MDFSPLQISERHLLSVAKNLNYNARIAYFYESLISESESKSISVLENKLERLKSCNSLWELDIYRESFVKDFLRTNLCRDKFCNNCKKVKQASRMVKFMPEIKKVSSDYFLSQMVLTVPNVCGADLRDTIKLLFKAFSCLMEYFSLRKKIKGVSFDFGYIGAIRSLEVTYKGDSYHPHLHVLLAHRKDFGKKIVLNKYSYDSINSRETRYFSDFEILIQKLWFTLIEDIRKANNTPFGFKTITYATKLGNFNLQKEIKTRRAKITKSRLDKIGVGYSCMIDKFKDEDFIELFKYITKGSKEDGFPMSYDNFKVLYFALNGVRQIQGYGCFYSIKDDDITDQVEDYYKTVIDYLQKKETPVTVSETVQAVLEDNSYTVISKSRIYSYVRHLEY